MRQLNPKIKTSTLASSSKPINKQDYDELVERVNTAIERLSLATDDLDRFKSELSNAITTNILNVADSATIYQAIVQEVEANLATLSTANIDVANIVYSTIKNARIDDLNANTIKTESLQATNTIETNILKASVIDTQELSLDTLNTESAEIDTIQTEEATIQTLKVEDTNSKKASIESLSSEEATIQTLESEDATFQNILSKEAELSVLDVEYIIHKNYINKQTIIDKDEYYIEVPYFTNGWYRLIATSDTDELLFAIEIHNSMRDNYFIRWARSKGDLPYIESCYRFDVKTDRPQMYFKCNTNGKAVNLYFISDSFDTELNPIIWNNWHIDVTNGGAMYYQLNYARGNKFFTPVDNYNENGQMGVLTIQSTDDVEEATEEDSVYDTQYDVTRVEYKPDQNVNTTSDVTFKSINIHDNASIDEDGNIISETITTNKYIKNRQLYAGPDELSEEELQDDFDNYAIIIMDDGE